MGWFTEIFDPARDILFGGDKKPQGTPGQVVDTTPAEFVNMRSTVANALGSLINNQGGSTFSDTTAPMTAFENAIVNRVGSAAGATSPLLADAAGLTRKTIAGDFLSPDSNPFLKQSIDAATRPLMEAFRDSEIPLLQSAFTRAGQFSGLSQEAASSPFDRSVALAGRALLDRIKDVSTGISSQNYQQERSRQQEAVDQAQALSTNEIDTSIKQLQAVALPRLIQQYGKDKGLEEFQRRMQTFLQALQLTGTLSSPQGQTATIQATAAPSGGGGLLSSLGPILGGIGSVIAASDRRVKEDILEVGELDNGLPVYMFRYKGGGPLQLGVMAQDVEKENPGAVIEIGGVKHVNYLEAVI